MAAVAHPTRLHTRRNSPLSIAHGLRGTVADVPAMKRIEMDDSDSDDEPPPAIKFSKVTQALLADAPLPSSPPKQDLGSGLDSRRLGRSASAGRANLDTPSRAPGIRIVRKQSPVYTVEGRGTTPSRVVHVGAGSAAKRAASIAGTQSSRIGTRRDPTPTHEAQQEIVTPAPGIRQVRVVTRSRANSNTSQDGRPAYISSATRSQSREAPRSAIESDNEREQGQDLIHSTSMPQGQDTIARLGSSTSGRTRNPSADALPPGSQRIKRAPITGSFLKSGPVRRGFRRRDSEENVSPADDPASGSVMNDVASNYTPHERGSAQAERPGSRSGGIHSRATSVEPVSVHDFARQKPSAAQVSRPSSRLTNASLPRGQMDSDHRPRSRAAHFEPSRSRQTSVDPPAQRRQTSVQPTDGLASVERSLSKPIMDHVSQQQSGPEHKPAERKPSLRAAQYRYVPPKPHSDALSDQENVPPPTFKRNKDQEFKYLGQATVENEKSKVRQVEETPVPVPPQQAPRVALGAISGNTPYRVAPAPPPKMSVLDAATTAAGASAAKSKKKRSHIVMNGKIYTQMGPIGKGGSCKVYCVMAENYKMFALKRVGLGDCDESAVRGFKGEIDLLNKLTEVERVVRLFDWELNDEKKELCLLMEKGDTDLNRLLTLRLNGENAAFDPAFARYYWREMLECVQAVHDQDIVHSDLKPANFLLVQGRLKLIDFGIANAIDTDNTVNVHRDTHVGTPNYMSPESIIDTNADNHHGGRDAAGRPVKKDMRIGKASDVWSLGCILYQMAYGAPPFAHITNQISRIMAITNPNHTIEFPSTGVGGAPIPPVLRGVLRRCLNRDPAVRPTCAQMLDPLDTYLNPGADGAVMINEELLGQIITKVVERCRDPLRGMPTSDEVRVYPRTFLEKIRERAEKG